MLLFAGRRGLGKTAVATKVALGRMDRGERVYANYEIRDRVNGRRAGRVYSLLDCLDLERCTVIIDEANMWTNSRMWQKVPPQILEAWQESRKSGLSFIFTSQHESRCDLVIRELVDYIMVCERIAFVPRWVPLFRVMRTHLEDVNEVRRGGAAPAEYYWLKDRVFASYDTKERLGGAAVAAMREYQAAFKRGEDPSELGITLPVRREPTIRHQGWWVERFIGTAPSAQTECSALGGGPGCVYPPLWVIPFDGGSLVPDYGWREKVSDQAA